MNRFIVGSFWSNAIPYADVIGMDNWMKLSCPEKFDWLIENAKRDWEYDLAIDHLDYDGQGNYNVFVVFDDLDDALLYKLRWG